jgi:hypothetical protein
MKNTKTKNKTKTYNYFELWVYYAPEFYYSGFSEYDKQIESIVTSVPNSMWYGQGCGDEADQSFFVKDADSLTTVMEKLDEFALANPDLNLHYEVKEIKNDDDNPFAQGE